MNTMQIKSKTNQDGTLHLHIETGLINSDVDITISFSGSHDPAGSESIADVLRKFAGCVSDATFVRPVQQEYEHREAFE